jgi:hypothetical protein
LILEEGVAGLYNELYEGSRKQPGWMDKEQFALLMIKNEKNED